MFLETLLSGLPQLMRLLFVLHVSSGNSFPRPLSAKNERECLKLIREGDAQARNRLIEHNLRLVVHIIKKYYSNIKDQDDLISIGTIGLIKAVSTFDYEKGTRFATYASRCIENEILMYFRNRKKTAQDVYIFDPIDTDKDGNALTLQDIMADEGSIFEDIEFRLRAQELHNSIESELNDRERDIVILRYGLHGKRPLTQREIAQSMGISRSYVSRLESKALSKLREKFEKKEK